MNNSIRPTLASLDLLRVSRALGPQLFRRLPRVDWIEEDADPELRGGEVPGHSGRAQGRRQMQVEVRGGDAQDQDVV